MVCIKKVLTTSLIRKTGSFTKILLGTTEQSAQDSRIEVCENS